MQQAFDVLSDPAARAEYDRGASDGDTASHACIIKLTSDGQPVRWACPVRVNQHVTGTGGWLETGTLVFRLPPGRLAYFVGDCAGDVTDVSSGGGLGFLLP